MSDRDEEYFSNNMLFDEPNMNFEQDVANEGLLDISQIWPFANSILSMSSDQTLSGTSSASTGRQSGRKKKKFTLILEYFFAGKRHPKREYFNVFIIRVIKKIFRSIIAGSSPKNFVIRIRAENEEETAIFRKFQDLYRANVDLIKELSKTSSGPETDGRSRRNQGERASHLSYNNDFCKKFFSERVMKSAFLLAIELIFLDFTSETLSGKLKFYCCESEEHSDQCWNKWKILKEYLENEYISDIYETPAITHFDSLREVNALNESFENLDLLIN